MKTAILSLVLALLIIQQGEAWSCIQGDGGNTNGQACNGEVNNCYKPKFIEYTGLAEGDYGCGTCANAGKTAGTDCTECDTEDCNTREATGTDFNCHTYTINADKTAFTKTGTVTCKRLVQTSIKCNMPGNVFDNTFTVSEDGCGPCDATAMAANKCAECDSAECNVMPSPIKCIQGDGSDMTAKDCLPAQGETTPTKCSQAQFLQYTGLAAGQDYACGACAANSDGDEKCQDCDGNSSAACNTKIETDENFKCYDYELKDEKLVKKDTAVTCQRLKDTPIKCNMPGTAADTTYSVKNNGCGPCETEDKTSNKCADCDEEECNSAFSFAVTALFLPLLSALYSLL